MHLKMSSRKFCLGFNVLIAPLGSANTRSKTGYNALIRIHVCSQTWEYTQVVIKRLPKFVINIYSKIILVIKHVIMNLRRNYVYFQSCNCVLTSQLHMFPKRTYVCS